MKHHIPNLRFLFQKDVRAHASPGPLDFLWNAVTNQECLALDPVGPSRFLCVLNHGFARLACQGFPHCMLGTSSRQWIC